MSDAVSDAVGGAVGGVVFLTSRRTPPDVVTFLQQQLARGEDSVVDDGGGVGSARGGEGRGEDNGGREGERHYWPPLSSFSPSFLWDPTLHGGDGRGGEGSNPYIRCLAAAAVIIVTPDSVSMASEACSTTAQVFVVEVDANAAAAGDDDDDGNDEGGGRTKGGTARAVRAVGSVGGGGGGGGGGETGGDTGGDSGRGELRPKLRRFHQHLRDTRALSASGVAAALAARVERFDESRDGSVSAGRSGQISKRLDDTGTAEPSTLSFDCYSLRN